MPVNIIEIADKIFAITARGPQMLIYLGVMLKSAYINKTTKTYSPADTSCEIM